MTTEEWKEVEKRLASFFETVKLDVDGYEVTLYLARVSTYKAGIAIYVNGVFEGKWLIKDCEERRRFVRKSERRVFSDKEIKKMGLSGKSAKEMKERKFPVYYNTWNSFKALKRHLIANNKEIKLIRG